MTDYSALKKAAEAALAYWAEEYPDRQGYPEHYIDITETDDQPEFEFYRDANPAAVLGLLADLDEAQLEMSGVETAKKDLAEVLGCADEPRWKWLYCNASELVRQNEQLKAEAERWKEKYSDSALKYLELTAKLEAMTKEQP